MTKTADIILQGLKELGIAHLFCLPGVQNDDFFDALFGAGLWLCNTNF